MKVDEVLHWLERAGEDLTLVGGQSVALWEHLLGLPVLTETVDIDFLGDAAQAQELADALGYDCRLAKSSIMDFLPALSLESHLDGGNPPIKLERPPLHVVERHG